MIDRSTPAPISERFASVGGGEATVERVGGSFEPRVTSSTDITRRPRLAPAPFTPRLHVVTKVLDSWHVGEYTTPQSLAPRAQSRLVLRSLRDMLAPLSTSRRISLVLLLFVAISAAYTWPLLRDGSDRIACDPFDPVLNAAILWWNATTVPLTPTWWNPPYFYPTPGVSAFTENLLGLWVISTPLYWLTRDPILTYNLTLFATWPLSALAVYLLVRRLSGNDGAAIVAGLACGFAPYRMTEYAHLQMLAVFWLPLAFLGLHEFLRTRRRRWLIVFGSCWLLQSLANSYLMVFGAVLIAMWVAFFVARQATWRLLGPIVAAWGAFSVPLLAVMLKYREVHEQFGLHRGWEAAIQFSAKPTSWLVAPHTIWLWGRILPGSENELFPGLTVLTIVLLGCASLLERGATVDRRPWRRIARVILGCVAGLALLSTAWVLFSGPWSLGPFGIRVRTAGLIRGVVLFVGSATGLTLLWPTMSRAWSTRSPAVFYGLSTVVMAAFSCGPQVVVNDVLVSASMPYRWLAALPGAGELRVPTRFWVLGAFCLAMAAGLGLSRLQRLWPRAKTVLTIVAAAGVLADGWIVGLPMAQAPKRHQGVEALASRDPLVELPLGPNWDAAATYRSIGHRRPVLNGVSGYDPPHYAPLLIGLGARDPQMLEAIASLGAFDIVVNKRADPDGVMAKYAAAGAGAARVSTDGLSETWHIPRMSRSTPSPGMAVPVRGVRGSVTAGTAFASDGRLETAWFAKPQRPGQWFAIELARASTVFALEYAIGTSTREFARRLAIDVSLDGEEWTQVWEGASASEAFLAAIRGPRTTWMRFEFPPCDARFVRLRPLAQDADAWRVTEFRVLAPIGR